MREFSQRGYSPSRRRFLEVLSYGLGAIAAGFIAIPFVAGYLAPQLAEPPEQWRRVGRVTDFKVGGYQLVTFLNASPVPWSGVTAKQAVWLRRNPNNQFTALSIYCQHLGCPVRWEPGSQLFLCPCHGGVYYANGDVAAGPPERGLQPFQTRVRNGQVEIRTDKIPYP
jgi:menaquinol-cytochrome c reductase iron-sulfur subunit